MKRTAQDLNTGDLNTETDAKATSNNKRKKVRFEKPLDNKSIGNNIKAPISKKNLKKKNVQAQPTEKINLLKSLKEKKAFGEKVKREDKSKHGKNVQPAKNAGTTEKTDWRKMKKEMKELREKRRAKKFNDIKYDKIVEAKRISEKLRRSDCKPEDRTKLIQTLHSMLEKHYSSVIFTHDMARVIQCMIKYCEADIREAIFHEIKPLIVQMIQSKYAKSCVRKLLKHGSRELRNNVINTFYGNIVRLMSHDVSAPLVELAYTTWCTDLDKMYFKQEFYGDMYKQAKDKAVKTLSDAFENAEGMKSATLSAVKTNLIRILNKELVYSSLVHTILWEFFNLCSKEDRSDLIALLPNCIVPLSQTKFGAKVAVQCIWHGTNKDRKAVMKALKENVTAICTSEHGYIILLALFDSVDDTVLVKKIILAEMKENLTNIALNEYGRHVILYLVARRDSRYFPPSVVEYLRQGDDNSTSKKPADIRKRELLDAIHEPLLEAVTADAAAWLSNSATAMVTLAILKVGSGDKLKLAFESIAKYIQDVSSKIKEDDAECSLIEDPGLHMMLKKLIQNDKELLKKNEVTFGDTLLLHLTLKDIDRWIGFNRGCFLIISLIENESTETADKLLDQLAQLKKNLESNQSPGKVIILKKLKEKLKNVERTLHNPRKVIEASKK